MRRRESATALRREEALILAWIGEVTAEKQSRLLEIRRRLRRIARAQWEKRRIETAAQQAAGKRLASKDSG